MTDAVVFIEERKMRRFLASLFIASIATAGVALGAENPNGYFRFGQLTVYNEYHSTDTVSYACGLYSTPFDFLDKPVGISASTYLGDGGLNAKMTFDPFYIRRYVSGDKYPSEFKVGGLALLRFKTATAGTMIFPGRGHGRDRLGIIFSIPSKFPFSGFSSDVDASGALRINFTLNLNTFNTCNVGVQGMYYP